MRKNKIKEEIVFSDRALDKKGNVISIKKRVLDISNINTLLKAGSSFKLTLKQYRFLKMMETSEVVSYKQREWIDGMMDSYNNKIYENKKTII